MSKAKVSRRSLRYATHHLMVMHPHTWTILFKKQLFDLEVNGQGPTKVIMVRDTPPYGHAPTYQISLTYLKRQKCYDPDKKILFKKTIIWPWGQRSLRYATHCLMVMHPHTKYHWPQTFLNSSQSETRIALGGHICWRNGTIWKNCIEDLT
jgi:hypothetical protein